MQGSDATYAAPLKVTVRLRKSRPRRLRSRRFYTGDFPIMTKAGTFMINGAERVVVSQIIRSPSVYYEKRTDNKTGVTVYATTVIPYRGAWLEYETDASNNFHVRVDKNRKLPITWLLKAISKPTDEPYTWLSMSGGEAGATTASSLK